MLKEILEVMDLLDDPKITGLRVAEWLASEGAKEVKVVRVEGSYGYTDFVKIIVPSPCKTGPTLGIIGRLGGIGARPRILGLVSDADGAIVALAVAVKLLKMAARGDSLSGDVIITTHICPNAPVVPHEPTPFMGSPVDMATMNQYEVDPKMDAILSIDATKGNWVVKRRGFAITPTVKEGYILRVSDDLLGIMRIVTGEPPLVVPLTTQDITPYGNGLYHINSIVQPSTVTTSPVVGVATTAFLPIPGCASGANQPYDLEMAARFCVEVSKAFTAGRCAFYDKDEFEKLVALYGSLRHLQTLGRGSL